MEGMAADEELYDDRALEYMITMENPENIREFEIQLISAVTVLVYSWV